MPLTGYHLGIRMESSLRKSDGTIRKRRVEMTEPDLVERDVLPIDGEAEHAIRRLAERRDTEQSG